MKDLLKYRAGRSQDPVYGLAGPAVKGVIQCIFPHRNHECGHVTVGREEIAHDEGVVEGVGPGLVNPFLVLGGFGKEYSGIDLAPFSADTAQTEEIVHPLHKVKFFQGIVQIFEGSQFIRRPEIGVPDVDNGAVVGTKLPGDFVIDGQVGIGSRYQTAEAGVHTEFGNTPGRKTGNGGQQQKSDQPVFQTKCEKSGKHHWLSSKFRVTG